jgi:Phosphoesterase family
MNRSFWTAATSSGFVVNSPMSKWFAKNDAETIFDRLEARGRTWKVYVMEPMPVSFTGVIHFPRLKDRLATHFVPFAEFEKDAVEGTLPDFSLIEPNMLTGHGDYHPAFGRSFSAAVDLKMDSPSAMLGGEAFLERVFTAYRSATSETGANVWNTAADRVGRTRRHLRSCPAWAGPAAGPGRAARRVRLRLRSLRVPGTRCHRVAVGGARIGVQRGVQAHLADRHAAQDLESGRGVHWTGCLGPYVRACSRAPRPATRKAGRSQGESCTRMDGGPRGDRQALSSLGKGLVPAFIAMA